jgi:hypothetical protein
MNTRSPRLCWKTLTAGLLAFGLLLSGRSLRAAEPGQDEVTLKNGGSIRGTIVSSEPGTSVKIIEVGQTQARVIPWSQVSDVEKGKYAPAPVAQPGPAGPGYGAAVPVPPPAAAGPPPPKMGDPGVVRVHVESPLPATIIERRSALVGAYQGYGIVLTAERKVCTSPCDAVFDGSEGHLFILADDQYPSGGPFNFAGMSGDVNMRVEPGSKGMRIGGVLGIVFGATAVATGAVIIPLALKSSTTDLNTGAVVSVANVSARNAGIGVLAGGAVALGAGIALVVVGSTKITIAPAHAKAAARQPRYWMGEF